MVRKLKQHFNQKFDALYAFKDQTMEQINRWLTHLKSVMVELNVSSPSKIQDSRDQDEQPSDGSDVDDDEIYSRKYSWSPSENPELDLPNVSDEEAPQVSAHVWLDPSSGCSCLSERRRRRKRGQRQGKTAGGVAERRVRSGRRRHATGHHDGQVHGGLRSGRDQRPGAVRVQPPRAVDPEGLAKAAAGSDVRRPEAKDSRGHQEL